MLDSFTLKVVLCSSGEVELYLHTKCNGNSYRRPKWSYKAKSPCDIVRIKHCHSKTLVLCTDSLSLKDVHDLTYRHRPM